MSDIAQARKALVARILEGDGHASRALRRPLLDHRLQVRIGECLRPRMQERQQRESRLDSAMAPWLPSESHGTGVDPVGAALVPRSRRGSEGAPRSGRRGGTRRWPSCPLGAPADRYRQIPLTSGRSSSDICCVSVPRRCSLASGRVTVGFRESSSRIPGRSPGPRRACHCSGFLSASRSMTSLAPSQLRGREDVSRDGNTRNGKTPAFCRKRPGRIEFASRSGTLCWRCWRHRRWTMSPSITHGRRPMPESFTRAS